MSSVAPALLVLASAALGSAPVVEVGRTRVHICEESVFRVTHAPEDGPEPAKESLVVVADWPGAKYTKDEKGDSVTVCTSAMCATVDKKTELVSFSAAGDAMNVPSAEAVLAESSYAFSPIVDMGNTTYAMNQSWFTSPSESFYGGGEYQNGIIEYRTAPIKMIQFNTEAIVPFFVSSKGYGILWDNYAAGYLNPVTDADKLEFSGHPFKAKFTAPVDGVYHFHIKRKAGDAWSKGTPTYQLNISGSGMDPTAIIDWDALSNSPDAITGRIDLKAGAQYDLILNSNEGASGYAGVYFTRPDRKTTTLSSEFSNLIDYYAFFGGSMDANIAGYRRATGAAHKYGRWAYGFWQCKEHYHNQSELLDAAAEFRARGIPLDAIVQDWHYWGNLGWGPQWDASVYPDPAGMVQKLASQNLKLMVSVWSKFDKNTKFYTEMNSIGRIIDNSLYYDAYSPDGRALFYNFSKSAMFDIGVESLWLDATEPEGLPNSNQRLFLGTGNAYMNPYSLQTTRAIAEGLRRDFPDKQGARVFALTRSSFAGQQRYGACLWSGDTTSKWDVLRRQVAASINYQMSGIPYWSEDIGGFFRPKDQYTSEDYHNLLIRWFDFGAFTPIYRVHGGGSNTEMWNYGDAVMKRLNQTNNLRYRLLPYTYSGFQDVYSDGYTMQRALAFDFGVDERVKDIADQFMYGPAFMVLPIVSQADHDAGSRKGYLPPSASWVDFWTGETAGSGDISAEAPIDWSPLFVRAGSVVPMGSIRQFAFDGDDKTLEIRVYPGDDGSFVLHEDDGLSGEYKMGALSSISFDWNDSAKQLTVGARKGSFKGMLENRTFNVVLVSKDKGVGIAVSQPDKTVDYDGSQVKISF